MRQREHPDLPEALKTAAGELTATLWSAAQVQAHDALISYRNEAQAAVIEAKAGITAAELERDACSHALEQAQQALSDANKRTDVLNQQLAAAGATNAAFESQVQQAKAENTMHQQRLDDARREFTAELDKVRAAAQRAEERLRATETRALLEIDRERSAAAKLQKELETARNAGNLAADRHRVEIAVLQEQLGDFREKAGMLEGSLQAITSGRDVAVNELKGTQINLADATAQLSMLRTKAANWQREAEDAQRLLAELRETQKPARTRRKPKVE